MSTTEWMNPAQTFEIEHTSFTTLDFQVRDKLKVSIFSEQGNPTNVRAIDIRDGSRLPCRLPDRCPPR